MKKLAILLLVMFAGTALYSQSTTGFVDVESIENNKQAAWFTNTYSAYEPDKLVIDSMMSLPSDYKVLVFGGIWCDDTKNLLPKLYKCSDQVNISRADISLYLLDEQKHSPQGLEKQYNITSVPTFIVMQNGAEKGRITEAVRSSLEKDLLHIMK